MQNRKTQSFKPLTISANDLPALRDRLDQQDQATSYAAGRAKLLLGCYRTGEANDPGTYVAAITAVLSRFPEEVMTSVTHPVTGLPSQKAWLPNVKEVRDACELAWEPIRENERRLKRIQEQIEMRERVESGEKPTMEQLREKYGDNWGIDPTGGESIKAPSAPAPSWDDITASYSADPSRLARLLNAKEA